MDETQVGGVTPGQKGRGIPSKALVVIAAQELGAGIGRIRMARIPEGSAEQLHRFIGGAIVQGSCVHTDGWKPYQGLDQLGYQHEVSKLKGLKKSAGVCRGTVADQWQKVSVDITQLAGTVATFVFEISSVDNLASVALLDDIAVGERAWGE